MTQSRVFRAGQEVEDLCRACKLDRLHTVIVVDGNGWPLRVQCSFCQSQHNYRGGPRTTSYSQGPNSQALPTPRAQSPEPRAQSPEPLVSDRERTAPPMSLQDRSEDLELLLRRIIREEAGLTAVAPAQKWRGGTMVLRPGTPGLQEKTWPIETFFHKVVMLRNRLRTLEQQVNASDLPEDAKVKLQSYVSGCYGSLTSFNVLFAEEERSVQGQRRGLGGPEGPPLRSVFRQERSRWRCSRVGGRYRCPARGALRCIRSAPTGTRRQCGRPRRCSRLRSD